MILPLPTARRVPVAVLLAAVLPALVAVVPVLVAVVPVLAAVLAPPA